MNELRQELEIEQERRRTVEFDLTRSLIEEEKAREAGTLRDQFAKSALTGIVSYVYTKEGSELLLKKAADVGIKAGRFVADVAYEYADAMLEARKQ